MPTSTVFNIDCMEYMQTLKDKSVSLAIVDPPYGIGMDNSNKRTKPSRPNSYTNYKPLRYKESKWDSNIPTDEYFSELFRVSQNQIIWGANYFCTKLKDFNGWIFWNKLNGENNCFSDGEFAYSSKGIQSRYIAISVFDGTNGGKDRIHPTQKPVALYRWLLENYAKQGDTILDTHMGSQSSRIAAYDMGFDYVGCELDKDYFEAGNKRFENFKAQLKLF